jgi:hypothetical protein
MVTNMKWRMLVGAVVGVFAGGLCVAAVEAIAHQVLRGQAVFVAAAAALALASAVGVAVAVWLGQSAASGWVVNAALGSLMLVNVFSFPHPVWYVPAAGAALLLGAWFSTALMSRKVAGR